MENSLALENITRFLLAIDKMKKMNTPGRMDESGVSIRQDKLETVHETLRMFSEFLPDNRGGLVTGALQKSSGYSRAYREIKRHVRYEGASKTDLAKVAKAVKAVAPMLENRQKIWLEKLIGIADILNS